MALHLFEKSGLTAAKNSSLSAINLDFNNYSNLLFNVYWRIEVEQNENEDLRLLN